MTDQLDLFAPDVASGGMRGGAHFSPCGRFRFWLSRTWGPGDRTATIVGCNPSTAGADPTDNDQTVTKGIGFARRWGCERLVMVNPSAYIATDPDDMHRAAKDGIDVTGGEENETAIRQAIGMALLTKGLLVLGCGTDTPLERLRAVLRQVRFGGIEPMCLGQNKNGSPKHPLYLAYSTPLVPFDPSRLPAEVS